MADRGAALTNNRWAIAIGRVATDLAGRRYRATLAVMLVTAFAVRVALRLADGAASFWTNSYILFFDLAQSMIAGRGYAFIGHPPTAFRVPLYPMFIAAVTRGQHDFIALTIAQALVSNGTVACAAALAHRLFDRRAALCAALITAFYPYYAWHDTSLQETGLFTFLTVAAMLLLVVTRRGRGAGIATGTGVVLGLAILTRATLAPFSLFAILWLLLPDERGTAARRRILTALLCLAALAATLSPWLIRAQAITGHFTLGTEFGGAVYRGNNPETFSFYPDRTIDLSWQRANQMLPPMERQRLDAMPLFGTEGSDEYLRLGLDYIRAHPGRFVVNAVRKNIAAFRWLPSPRHDLATDLIEALSYGPIMLLGLAGLWADRRRWRFDMLFYVQFVFFAAITGLLWGHSSHRAFLDVYLIVFAAGFVVARLPGGGDMFSSPMEAEAQSGRQM